MWNFIKVYYYHFVHFQLKGIKPTRYRENLEKNNGYSIHGITRTIIDEVV